MRVYVMPGTTPPTPLVLINELNKIRFNNAITSIRVKKDDESQNSQVAREWARIRDIPVTNGGIPRIILFTTDMTEPGGLPDIEKGPWRAWNRARQEDPDQSLMTALRYLIANKKTVWVNTGHIDYTNMMSRKKLLEEGG